MKVSKPKKKNDLSWRKVWRKSALENILCYSFLLHPDSVTPPTVSALQWCFYHLSWTPVVLNSFTTTTPIWRNQHEKSRVFISTGTGQIRGGEKTTSFFNHITSVWNSDSKTLMLFSMYLGTKTWFQISQKKNLHTDTATDQQTEWDEYLEYETLWDYLTLCQSWFSYISQKKKTLCETLKAFLIWSEMSTIIFIIPAVRRPQQEHCSFLGFDWMKMVQSSVQMLKVYF